MKFTAEQIETDLKDFFHDATIVPMVDENYESTSWPWISKSLQPKCADMFFDWGTEEWREDFDCDNFAFAVFARAQALFAERKWDRKVKYTSTAQAIGVGIILYDALIDEKPVLHAGNLFVEHDRTYQLFSSIPIPGERTDIGGGVKFAKDLVPAASVRMVIM